MDSNILSALLLYESDDNVTGLKKDIHTGCVNCYARKGSSKNKFIEILLSDFPTYVRKGLIYSKTHKEELEELVSEQYVYAFTHSTMLKKQAQKSEEKRVSQTRYGSVSRASARISLYNNCFCNNLYTAKALDILKKVQNEKIKTYNFARNLRRDDVCRRACGVLNFIRPG